VGTPLERDVWMGPVINEAAVKTYLSAIERAKKDGGKILVGGRRITEPPFDRGYFVEPTVVQAKTPDYRLMCEEIFGPVLTVFVYDDADWSKILRVVDETSPYALTGSVFATDRRAIHEASTILRNAAGNFYVNDKPTGAVVGQQPFGGSRGSGTNDKAGSKMNLLRWVSTRSIKETFSPPLEFTYPFMAAE